MICRRSDPPSRVAYISDRISRAFWIAFMATLDPDVEEIFSIAQDLQMSLKAAMRSKPLEDWSEELQEEHVANYTRLIEKATLLAKFAHG